MSSPLPNAPITNPSHALLSRAHSPDTALRIFKERVQNRPLPLRPTEQDASTTDARTQRQQARLAKATARRKSNKPRPLSAKQKRALCVYEIPAAQRKWSIYVPLHRLWVGYIRGVLGLKGDGSGYVAPQSAGPLLASADFHGAEVEVVRSRCVGRVGLRGIVLKDTKFTFELVTKGNEVKSMCVLVCSVD